MSLILLAILEVSCVQVETEGNSKEAPMEVDMVRQLQLVKRFNCDGELTSEQVETIAPLSFGLMIKAEDSRNLWEFRAHGGSGDYKGTLWRDYGQVTLDYSPTVFNIRVRQGLNEIKYQFGYCDDVRIDPVSSRNYCANEVSYSNEKSHWVYINYEVRNLTGVKEIHPSTESCESMRSRYNCRVSGAVCSIQKEKLKICKMNKITETFLE